MSAATSSVATPFSHARSRRIALALIAGAWAMLFALAALFVLPTKALAYGTSQEPFASVAKGSGSNGSYSGCTVSEGGTKITLTSDVTLSDYWYITTSSKVTLDLNGHKLRRSLSSAKGWGCVIYLENDARLAVYDSAGGGSITGGKSKDYGGGIYAAKRTRLWLYGGSIAGNSSTDGGGGVYLASGAMLYQYGGSISSNEANNEYGGGVYCDKDSRIYLYGGSIQNNTVGTKGYGGGVYVHKCHVEFSGGTVSGNSAGYGGGIYVDGTNDDDWGCYLQGSVTITSNSSVKDGGGVYESSGSRMWLQGSASVTNNTASGDGGGIYADSSVFSYSYITFAGSPTVWDNSSGSGTRSNLQLYSLNVGLGGLGDLTGGKIGLTPSMRGYNDWSRQVDPVVNSLDASVGSGWGTFPLSAHVTDYLECDLEGWDFYVTGVSSKKDVLPTTGHLNMSYYRFNTDGSFPGNAYNPGDNIPMLFKVGIDGVYSEFSDNCSHYDVKVPNGTDVTSLTPNLSYAYTAAVYIKDIDSDSYTKYTGGPVDFSVDREFVLMGKEIDYKYHFTVFTISVKAAAADDTCTLTLTSQCEQVRPYIVGYNTTTFGGTGTTTAQIPFGAEVTIDATSDPGYLFSSWDLGGWETSWKGIERLMRRTTFTMRGQSKTVVARGGYYPIKACVQSADGKTYKSHKSFSLGTVADLTKLYDNDFIADADKIVKWTFTTLNGDEYVGDIPTPESQSSYTVGYIKNGSVAYRTVVFTYYLEGEYEEGDAGDLALSVNALYGASVSAVERDGVDVTSSYDGTVYSGDLVTFSAPSGAETDGWELEEGCFEATDDPDTFKVVAGGLDDEDGSIDTTLDVAPSYVYDVTVKNGYASTSSCADGTEVKATANPYKDGHAFDHWEAEGLELTDEQRTSSSLSFTMPAGDVALTACYDDSELYAVLLNGGTFYEAPAGTEVTVDVNARYFRGWSDVSGLDEATTQAILADTTGSVSFTMPAGQVLLTANHYNVVGEVQATSDGSGSYAVEAVGNAPGLLAIEKVSTVAGDEAGTQTVVYRVCLAGDDADGCIFDNTLDLYVDGTRVCAELSDDLRSFTFELTEKTASNGGSGSGSSVEPSVKPSGAGTSTATTSSASGTSKKLPASGDASVAACLPLVVGTAAAAFLAALRFRLRRS